MRKCATPQPIPSTWDTIFPATYPKYLGYYFPRYQSQVLGIGSGVARFLMTAEYATYRYLRCVVNVMRLLSQLSVSFNTIFIYLFLFLFGKKACTRLFEQIK